MENFKELWFFIEYIIMSADSQATMLMHIYFKNTTNTTNCFMLKVKKTKNKNKKSDEE